MTTANSVKTQVSEILGSASSLAVLKLPGTFLVGTAEWLFGVGNIASLQMLLALIVIDLITAIGAAFKTGKHIESRKALKTVTKMVVYGAMASAAHLSGVVMDAGFIVTATLAFLAVTELISIIENAGKMGYAIPNKLLNKLTELRDK